MLISAKKLPILFLVIFSTPAISQVTLFDNSKAVQLVKEGSEYLYATDTDSTNYYIERLESEIPGHPVIPMMKGMLILWENIPVLQNEEFERFKSRMEEVIERSNKMDREHPESVFFEMSARGILAEYYADRGLYMAAIGEATQAYGLLRRGFDLVEDLSEFGFLLGIYNYFREAYPERHPVVKPFIWFFRGGDKTLGLNQIKNASKNSIISSVEATIYLSYIYLRYEEKPVQAQEYVRTLVNRYPDNLYILTKYLESMNIPGFYDQMPKQFMDQLIASGRTYYMLVGNVFRGIYQEKVEKNEDKAFQFYTQAIALGEVIEEFGEHYKSLAYLGAGRISSSRGNDEAARAFLRKSIEFSETNEVTGEAKELMP